MRGRSLSHLKNKPSPSAHAYGAYFTRMSARQFPLAIKYCILGALILIGFYYAVMSNWHAVFMISQAFLFSLIPSFLQKLYGVRTPRILQAGVVFFMFATIFLGEVANFYELFWWWDLIWHTLAGTVFCLIGFIILILTYRRQNVRLNSLFSTVFAVSFSLASSVLWEILEFVIDLTFGTNMQPSGSDTMWDLVVGLFGALIGAFSGYRYVQYRECIGMNAIIDDGVQKNIH